MADACRIGNSIARDKVFSNRDESFCIFNVFCVFISLITILADLTTEVLVFAEYCKNGYLYWAVTTLFFILLPNVLINIFSMKWIVIDQEANLQQWLSHWCLFGLFERYVRFLQKIFSCKNLELMKSEKLLSQRNDLSLLHFLYTFTGTLPQIILQSYAIITMEDNHDTKAFSLTASTASVIWACASYIYSITSFHSQQFQWNSVISKLVWHFGMLIARISGILLFAIVFNIWTLIPFGLHWAIMTFWIVTQKTTFCPNKLEETFYNGVMGFVYCFCYINLRRGHTRYRLLMYYTLMISENFGSLFIYILISDLDRQRRTWSILATASVVAGTVIGLCGMILYYRWFHAKGPILWNDLQNDLELNNKIQLKNDKPNSTQTTLSHVRSFKSDKDPQEILCTKVEETSVDKVQQIEINKNSDQKFLLDHWVARSGTPTFVTAPVGNDSMDVSSIQFHSIIENTPQNKDEKKWSISKNAKVTKKKSNNSSNEVSINLSIFENLESSIDDLTASNLNLHKRRGICSSDELKEDLNNLDYDVCKISSDYYNKQKTCHGSEISQDTDSSNKKSSDSIDMDLDLSFSDINSSDINTFNENIVQKLCLSAIKNIKVGNRDADIENIQRIALDILREMYSKKGKNKCLSDKAVFNTNPRDLDTPTESLSVHDYENICAVNIAREAWGLRSWNGYCDIENWLHDGSVFRDRRRDTLTSASSEFSSCISQDFRNSIISAPPFPKRAPTYSNIFVKSEKPQPDYVNTNLNVLSDETFLARPCFVDSKDPNHLEPILEELDDLGDIDTPINKKQLNSESSLVATIDEIRKVIATNSPRNLYHRSENSLDSPQSTHSAKMDLHLKQALWKAPSIFNSNNIMKTILEKENNLAMQQDSKSNLTKKDINLITISKSLSPHASDHNASCSKNKRLRTKSNNYETPEKKINNKCEEKDDLSSKDIDLLWKMVSNNSLNVDTIEELPSNQISTSLQSLISNETLTSTSVKKLNMNKKGGKGKSRRKFSILRERFEPKNSRLQEETLHRHNGNTNSGYISTTSVVHVKNMLDVNKHTALPQCKEINNSTTDDERLMAREFNRLYDTKENSNNFLTHAASLPKPNTKLRRKV